MMFRNGCMADARSRCAVWLGAIAFAVLASAGEGADESFSKSWTSWPDGKRFQDVDPEMQSRLFDAAYQDDRQAVEALLGRDMGSDAGDLLGDVLIEAARQDSAAVVALLLERGVDASRGDAFGWTPLHKALLVLGPRRKMEVANLLLQRGADVNAATRLTGWTPLHLAAHLSGSYAWRDEDKVEVLEHAPGPDVVEMVQTLIERGADVNARTLIGGWTPLRVAKEADKSVRYGLPRTDSSKAVLAALQGAGGVEDSAPLMLHSPAEFMQFNSESEVLVPESIFGYFSVRGSFSVAGAEEQLLFEFLGIEDIMAYIFEIVALEDRHGNIRPFRIHVREYEELAGLCLDGETGTHNAIFVRTRRKPYYDAPYFYHYNKDTGTLVPSFDDNRSPDIWKLGSDKPCVWHD